MTHRTIKVSQVSSPAVAPAGALVTITPTPGGAAKVEYNAGSSVDVGNNATAWVEWPKGLVTTPTSDVVVDSGFLRVTAIKKDVKYEINGSPTAAALSTLRPDWASIQVAAPVIIAGGRTVGYVVTANVQPGYAPTSYQWYRNGAAISGATASTYPRVTADIGTALTLIAGGIAFTADGGITMPDVPDAPIIGALSASETSATLTFTPPANNGGDVVVRATATLYKALDNSVIQAATIYGSATSFSFTGLTTGVPIYAKVTVTNITGESLPSAASNIATPAVVIGTLRQVSDRCFFPTEVSPQTNALFSSVHTAFEGITPSTSMTFGYPLFVTQDEVNSSGGTAIGSVEMSLVVEYPIGSGTQGTITTSATGTAGSVLIATGPAGVTIPKGALYKIKGALRTTGGGFPYTKFGAGRYNGSAYELLAQQSTTNVLTRPYTDSAATWNARTNDFSSGQTAQYAVMPAFILAVSTCKSVFIMGDSRSAGGSGDYVNDSTLQMGAACRFLNGKVAYVNASMNGDKAMLWANGSHGAKRIAAALQYCTGFMDAMGTNDYVAAADTPTLIAIDATIKTNIAGASINPYYGVTIPPTTTDGNSRFYTEASQGASAFNGARRSLNAYRMAQVGALYDKVFDQAATFEGVDTSKWAVAPTARAQNITTVAASSQITGTFTPADDGLFCLAVGAESGSTDFLFYLSYVNGTTANVLSGTGALKPVTLGGTFNTYFGYQFNTFDGIHESTTAGARMKAIGLTAAP